MIITSTVNDISQLAKIRWMTQSIENLATQVYLNSVDRSVIDQISATLAGAFEQIAGYGDLQTTSYVADLAGNCAAGWCWDGSGCYPCAGPQVFPRVVAPSGPRRSQEKTAEDMKQKAKDAKREDKDKKDRG